MGGVIAGLIARYGSPVTLTGAAGTQTVTAMLQPLRYRGRQNSFRDWSDPGSREPGRYLLLCSSAPEGYDMVACGGRRYWLRHWDAFEAEGQPLYYWAVLTREE